MNVSDIVDGDLDDFNNKIKLVSDPLKLKLISSYINNLLKINCDEIIMLLNEKDELIKKHQNNILKKDYIEKINEN